MTEYLFWDLDATLLDFAAAERNSIRACFASHGMNGCTEERISRYSVINKRYWERLERGEISREEVKLGRFLEFFSAEHIDCPDPEAFCRDYEYHLGDTIVYCDDSYNLVKRLRGRVKQYVVTNGSLSVQRRKMERSGFGALMDGCFISEELGAEKPNPAFFGEIWRRIGTDAHERSLLVGDSLTSDIPGAAHAGIRSVWYNPSGQQNYTSAHPDYEIRSLQEVEELLAKGSL